MTEDLILWVVLLGAGAAVLLVVIPTLWTGAPPTPSGRAVRSCVVETLTAQDLPAGAVYDFGSGWGGMARVLAKSFPDRAVIGIESSFLPWLVSVVSQRLFGPRNLTFLYGDFRKHPLYDAAVVVCFLGPSLSQDVVSTVKSAGSSSLVVVSCFFALPVLIQVDSRTARDLYRTPVYIYRV